MGEGWRPWLSPSPPTIEDVPQLLPTVRMASQVVNPVRPFNAPAPPAPLAPRQPLPDGEPFTFFMDRLAEAFGTELTAFTEVVAGLRASPCTVLDAVETGWVAEACALSLREHRPVQIEEVRIS